MFYTKAKLNEEVTVTVELTDENVFCTCPDCGDEVCVNLSEVFADGIGDMYGTAVLCQDCAMRRIEHGKSV